MANPTALQIYLRDILAGSIVELHGHRVPENEYAMMQFAADVGLDVPDAVLSISTYTCAFTRTRLHLHKCERDIWALRR